jgi:soluble lytic murein transglycosylase
MMVAMQNTRLPMLIDQLNRWLNPSSGRAAAVLAALLTAAALCLTPETAQAQKRRAAAEPATPEEAYTQAREAFRAKNAARVAELAPAFADHPLAYYADYWQLMLQKEAQRNEGMEAAYLAFTEKYANQYLADRTRMDWLRALGRKAALAGGKPADWEAFNALFPKLIWDDQDTTCYSVYARYAGAAAQPVTPAAVVMQAPDTSAKDPAPVAVNPTEAALREAIALWNTPKDLPEGCTFLFERLLNDRKLAVGHVWERVRFLADYNVPNGARRVMGYLPDAQIPSEKDWGSALNSPQAWVNRMAGNAALLEDRSNRNLTLIALSRIARDNPTTARNAWEPIAKKGFTSDERQYGWGVIANHGARRHVGDTPEWALGWVSSAQPPENLEWLARGGLRGGDWKLVQRAIAAMPEPLQNESTWVYWKGRAAKAQGRAEEARALFEKIAAEFSFYGKLAGEELGRLSVAPPRTVTASPEGVATMKTTAGFQRAQALYRLGLRVDANREWNFQLTGFSDQQLIDAAEYARQQSILDRAVNTADRTKEKHDFGLRFIAPFRENVKAKAQENGVEEAWVYGLIRQESRFIMDARSHVGASGLMQLMPATARFVAKRLGMNDFTPGQVNDLDTNAALGTAYLKMVLDDLGHPVLASAGYNAGPGRPRRWRDTKPLEGAIFAETIPFNETRDYVKKVMSNTVYYASLFTGKPQSLKERMGTMSARKADEKAAELP